MNPCRRFDISLGYLEARDFAPRCYLLIKVGKLSLCRAHSSAWIEWLPAKQLVEGSSPSGPALHKGSNTRVS